MIDDDSSIRFIARSFESLSEEDQQEIARLIEFKKEMAERRKKTEEIVTKSDGLKLFCKLSAS